MVQNIRENEKQSDGSYITKHRETNAKIVLYNTGEMNEDGSPIQTSVQNEIDNIKENTKNIPNVVTNDQTPTYTESEALVKLTSGEKLSVAFGKISKAITDLITHLADNVKHITSSERTNWNAAKTHASSTHAPSNAQANVIETVKVNGTALTPSSKAVDIIVPTNVDDKLESEIATNFSDADSPVFQQSIDNVLNEVGELKGDIVNLHEITELQFTSGGYIKTNVTNVDISTVISASSYNYCVAQCSKNELFTISGKGGDLPKLWCFTDNNGVMRAVSNNGAEETNRVIKAPCDGYLIINSTQTKKCYRGSVSEEHKIVDDINYCIGKELIIYKYDGFLRTNGTTVNIYDPISAIGNMYSVTECVKGDVFCVNATGGESPRAWAFADSNFNIVSKSDINATVTNLNIIAPCNGYLIINDKSGRTSYKGDIKLSEIKTNYCNGFYGHTPDSAFNVCDSLNLACNSIKNFDVPFAEFEKQLTDKFSNGAKLKIVNNSAYVSYSVNEAGENDNPASNNTYTVLTKIKDVTNMTIGDTILVARYGTELSNGKTIVSGVGEVNMVVDGNIIHIYLSAKLSDGKWHYIITDYNTLNDTLGALHECVMVVNDVEYEFTGNTIKSYINSNADDSYFLSMHTSYGVVSSDYYFGLCINNTLPNGIIVKTNSSDFSKFEFWLEPNVDGTLAQYELSLSAYNGFLYCAIRQHSGKKMLLLMIRISDKAIVQRSFIVDGMCRPEFFNKNEDTLYLIHTLVTSRQRSNIESIRTSDIGASYTLLQTVHYCANPSVDKYGNEFYIAYTNANARICLSKFTFSKIQSLNETVGMIRKMLDVFGK